LNIIIEKKKEFVYIEENKFIKEVSNAVWSCLKAVVLEKTIKKECIDQNCSNDNYYYILLTASLDCTYLIVVVIYERFEYLAA